MHSRTTLRNCPHSTSLYCFVATIAASDIALRCSRSIKIELIAVAMAGPSRDGTMRPSTSLRTTEPVSRVVTTGRPWASAS
jgi:hypothetical protein